MNNQNFYGKVLTTPISLLKTGSIEDMTSVKMFVVPEESDLIQILMVSFGKVIPGFNAAILLSFQCVMTPRNNIGNKSLPKCNCLVTPGRL